MFVREKRCEDMNFKTTKERIIYESLVLFSQKGYEGVSMREIAAAVEIKAASLYAHFSGKEAIYQAIVDTMKQRYNEKAMMLHIDGNIPDADITVYKNISTEQLYAIGEQLFLFFLHDEYTKMYRKMLTIEQFHNPVLAAEFSRQYYDEAIAYQKKLFAMLAGKENFIEADYEIMAVHFYSPMYTLITLCDRQPEREGEVLDLLKRHIEQFVRIYKKA